MPSRGMPVAAAGMKEPVGSRRMLAVYGRAVATSAGLFMAGFGVMNLFWWFGHWRADIPGLWDYRSATIGDGLLLPVAAGLLVTVGDRLPADTRQARAVMIATTLGALTGGWIQWASLRDTHPQLNWTMPAVHTLNAPGWYHAGLLVTVSGLFAGLTMRVLGRARSCRRSPNCVAGLSLRHPVTTVLTACLAGFVGLLVVDMYQARQTTTGAVAIGAALAAAAVAAGMLIWGYGWHRTLGAWGFLGAGLVLAVGLCWIAA